MTTIYKLFANSGLSLDAAAGQYGPLDFAQLAGLTVDYQGDRQFHASDGALTFSLLGEFAAYGATGWPSVGTITAIHFTPAGKGSNVVRFELDTPMPVSRFNDFRKAGAEDKLIDYLLRGDDTITGTDHADRIASGRGNDDVSSGAGNDRLQGEAGDDTLDGGAGVDILDGGIGDDHLLGGLNNDTLIGGAGSNILDGGAGVDTADYSKMRGMIVDLHAGQAFHSSGIDTLTSIENVIGSAGADAIIGNDLANILDGGAGDDSLNGRAGRDKLFGGDGDDVLDGGEDSDVLNGGDGADAFVFFGNSGRDFIEDFETGVDVVRLLDGGLTDFNAVLAAAVDSPAGHCVIRDGTRTIVLMNVAKTDLTAADFEFLMPAPVETPDKDGALTMPPEHGLDLAGDLPALLTSGGTPSTVDWLV